MAIYAHTNPHTPKDPSHWEPLFTPFGEDENQCQRKNCKKCADLEPQQDYIYDIQKG